jgi:hypothetical protein
MDGGGDLWYSIDNRSEAFARLIYPQGRDGGIGLVRFAIHLEAFSNG